MRPRTLALTACLLLPPLVPAAAQAPGRGSGDPLVGQIIEQLTPGSATRGIRIPQQESVPASPARPAPSQAAIRAETTAPAGTAALSVLVNFASGSAELSASSTRALAPLGEALASAALSSFRFRIEGHTDTTGGEALNQALSERRAAAVRDHLVRQYGVSPARLEVVGLGESSLLVRTGDEVSEARNRRVQVLNIGG